MATIDGRELKSASCTNSIVTPTLNMCKEALLKKCKPGAEIVDVGEQSRPVYRNGAWLTELTWTVMLKNC